MRAPGTAEVVVGPGHRAPAAPPRPAGRDSRSAPPAVDGAQDHRVARLGELAHLAGHAGPVAQDRLPPPALDQRARRGPRPSGPGTPRPPSVPASRRSKGACSRGASTAVLEAPGGGQGVGQGRLLVEQLGGPVAHPPGLDQDDQGVVAQQVAEELLALRPATGSHDSMPSNCSPSAMPVPLVAAPGCGAHQPGGPLAHGRRRRPARGSRTARPGRGRRWSAGRPRRSGSAGRPRRPTGRCAPARRRSTGTRRRSRPGRPARRGARPIDSRR